MFRKGFSAALLKMNPSFIQETELLSMETAGEFPGDKLGILDVRIRLKNGNDSQYCEIKRLYVRPEYRGQGISKKLTEQVIADAREIGYQYMRLDTFPFMSSAIKLYEKYGFKYIERYNDNLAETAIFMQLEL